jgi:hypothetical protein
MKNVRRQLQDIFSRMEGGHLVNANWLVQTLINIDLKSL